jgi:hypothetical protein
LGEEVWKVIIENLIGKTTVIINGASYQAQVKIPFATLDNKVLALLNKGQEELYSISIIEKAPKPALTLTGSDGSFLSVDSSGATIISRNIYN